MNKKPKRKRLPKSIQKSLETWKALAVRVFRILMISVFISRSDKPQNHQVAQPRTGKKPRQKKKWYTFSFIPWRRVGLETGLRLLEAPLLLLLCTAIIVIASVHPRQRQAVGSTPEGMGLYYEAVGFPSKDGTALNGWYIPSINAREVLEDGDAALTRKRPAAVICHGIGANRNQLMPLAYYLNNHGIEVMIFDFRNCGQSERRARSFGINEREDVLAAVHYLSQMSSVDPQQIYVIGQDMGGVAGLWAAGADPRIAGVIAADIHRNLDEAIAARLGYSPLHQAIATSFIWGCKTYFHTTDEQLSAIHAASLLHERQRLMLLTRELNTELDQTAKDILTRSKARGQKHVISQVTPCLLTEMEDVAPAIKDFILNPDRPAPEQPDQSDPEQTPADGVDASATETLAQ